jgi:hypothetical protein
MVHFRRETDQKIEAWSRPVVELQGVPAGGFCGLAPSKIPRRYVSTSIQAKCYHTSEIVVLFERLRALFGDGCSLLARLCKAKKIRETASWHSM